MKVDNFSKLEIKSIDEVVFENGDSSFVEIIGCNDNQLNIQGLQDKLVYEKKKEIEKIHVKIVFHCKALNEVKLSNIGEIRGNISSPFSKLVLDIKNSGNSTLNISCDDLHFTGMNLSKMEATGKVHSSHIKINNTAKVDFSKVTTSNVNFQGMNVANCSVYCSDTLDISASNCVSLVIIGNPHTVKKELTNVSSSSL
ncbi:MAG: DUF2807 domain-containing protein [Bacteroidia bacterium]